MDAETLDRVWTGSPPRMRGKQRPHSKGRRQRRITPADAGKTKRLAVYLRLPQDHPRGCGENDSINVIGNMNTGSPPRMRGKPVDGDQHRQAKGITPADAGKTVFAQALFHAVG